MAYYSSIDNAKEQTKMTRFHRDALDRGVFGIMPLVIEHRLPTIAEVLHFQTCHAAAPYSAVNCQVPAGVPVWQYVDQDERNAAARKCK